MKFVAWARLVGRVAIGVGGVDRVSLEGQRLLCEGEYNVECV